MDAFNSIEVETIVCKSVHCYPDQGQLYKDFTALEISVLPEKKLRTSPKALTGFHLSESD
jgi:hypothetical protein